MMHGDQANNAAPSSVQDKLAKAAEAGIALQNEGHALADQDRLYEDIEAELTASEFSDEDVFGEMIDETNLGEALDDVAWISAEAEAKGEKAKGEMMSESPASKPSDLEESSFSSLVSTKAFNPTGDDDAESDLKETSIEEDIAQALNEMKESDATADLTELTESVPETSDLQLSVSGRAEDSVAESVEAAEKTVEASEGIDASDDDARDNDEPRSGFVAPAALAAAAATVTTAATTDVFSAKTADDDTSDTPAVREPEISKADEKDRTEDISADAGAQKTTSEASDFEVEDPEPSDPEPSEAESDAGIVSATPAEKKPEVSEDKTPDVSDDEEADVSKDVGTNASEDTKTIEALDAIADRMAESDKRFDAALGKVSHFMGVVAERIDVIENRLEERPATEEIAPSLLSGGSSDTSDVAPYIANAEREIEQKRGNAPMDIFDRIAQAAETEYDSTKGPAQGERLGDTSVASGHRIGTKKWSSRRTVRRRMQDLNNSQPADAGVQAAQSNVAAQADQSRVAAQADLRSVAAEAASHEMDDQIAMPQEPAVAAMGSSVSAAATAAVRKPTEEQLRNEMNHNFDETKLDEEMLDAEADFEDPDGDLVVVPGARGRRRNRARKSKIDVEMENLFTEGDEGSSIQSLRKKLRTSASPEAESPEAAPEVDAEMDFADDAPAKKKGGSLFGGLAGMFAGKSKSKKADVLELDEPQLDMDADDADLMAAFEADGDFAENVGDLYDENDEAGQGGGLKSKLLLGGGGLLAAGAAYFGYTNFL